MKPINKMSQAELGAFVQSHLQRKGIEVILSGGACVAIYSSNRYASQGLDFVNAYSAKRSEIKRAMEEIGFNERARYFKHPESDFLIEFPPGPLSVGAEPVQSINELEFATGTLKLISPTDCVKDRLSAYFYWKDRQALSQAVLVARYNPIDQEEVSRWSKVEGKAKECQEIRELLK